MSHDEPETREERVIERLLTTSASMTGVCVALLSVVQIIADSRKVQTLADDALAIDSLFSCSAAISRSGRCARIATVARTCSPW
ncbi:hypothetical protein [Solimonas soli]|uniref:hypothetical protein n=1 Tax=Solimonas soli TaxID=413479 RepID=UPI000482714D|nr:hypothetical protein [Solimonas soli]